MIIHVIRVAQEEAVQGQVYTFKSTSVKYFFGTDAQIVVAIDILTLRVSLTPSMGCGNSSTNGDVNPALIQQVVDEVGFDRGVVEGLYRQFKMWDKSQNGYLTMDELGTLQELAINPLFELLVLAIHKEGDLASDVEVQRALAFDDIKISFSAFARCVARFSSVQDHPGLDPNFCGIDGRMEFYFRMFDITGTGRIRMSEVMALLNMLAPQMAEDRIMVFAEDILRELGDKESTVLIDHDTFMGHPVLREACQDLYFRI